MENTINNILADAIQTDVATIATTTTDLTTSTVTTSTATTTTATTTPSTTTPDNTTTATTTPTPTKNKLAEKEEEYDDDFLDYKFSQYLENGSSYDDNPLFDRDYGDDYDYDCDRDDAGYDSY
jgi:hypothetical protein